MAIKLTVDFSVKMVPDGQSTSVVANLISDPFAFVPAGTIGMTGLNMFAVSATKLPTAVQNLASSDGQEVTATLGLAGAITFTWPVAPAAGMVVTVTGTLVF